MSNGMGINRLINSMRRIHPNGSVLDCPPPTAEVYFIRAPETLQCMKVDFERNADTLHSTW